MATLLEAISKVKVGIWQFIRLVFSANRDYPFHDYKYLADGSEPAWYIVGSANVDARGDHSKLFVSKSTLIIVTQDTVVRFNNTRNVAQTLRAANSPYEFYGNIWAVNVTDIGEGGAVYMYFEGVLPEEARAPE